MNFNCFLCVDIHWQVSVQCKESITCSIENQGTLFHSCLHVNNLVVFHLTDTVWTNSQPAFWSRMLFSDKFDVWLEILICAITGIGANGTCWCSCQWSRVCLLPKLLYFGLLFTINSLIVQIIPCSYKFEFPTPDDRPGPPIISFRFRFWYLMLFMKSFWMFVILSTFSLRQILDIHVFSVE